MAFADLTANLRLDTKQFNRAMREARRQTQRFSSYLGRVAKEGTADKMIRGYTTLNDRLHRVGLGLRDIARISSGIIVSQSFYRMTGAINEATNAVWEFSKSVDYAHVTYGALFGDSELASGFIDTLKQFSIDTIFEYQDIEGMARKLSAYGIEYQNLMYIIEGLTNIGTISGDAAALERLAVAIGQINAKGTLKAEELRQLANAYTPIYDILRDKLGLTEDELDRVGDLGIQSADAINAIIEYANETFGATAEAATQTITGLNNRIVDSLKVLGSNAAQPLTNFYKSVAKSLSDWLNEINAIFDRQGTGGVFERLVPSEAWQQRLRSLLAALKNMVKTVAATIMTLWPYIKQYFGGIIDAFTILVGVINVALTALVGFLRSAAEHTPILKILTSALVAASAGFILFKLHALGALVVKAVSAAVVGLAKAVLVLTTVLTKHPIIAGLFLLGAVLVGVASNATNANSAIAKLVNSLNSYSIGGDTADDILQTKDAMEEGTDSSDKFWNSMEDGAKDAEDSIEGAGNSAKKAAKSLLSFDEVFKLDDAEGTDGSGVLDNMEDLSDALSGLGGALVPSIPDLSGFASDFVSTLYNDLFDAVKNIASGGATGALIGGLVGFAIGGLITKTMAGAMTGAKWGLRIGAVAGAAFAGFWTDTYKEMESALIKIAGGGSIGMLAGGLLGMVVGAFATKKLDGALAGAKLGAGIGTFVGAGIGAFWAGMTEEMSNAIEGLIVGGSTGAFAGSLVGFILGAYIGTPGKRLKSAIAGARLGTTIGAGVGAAFGALWGGLTDGVNSAIESSFVGGAFTGFAGAIMGMLVGAFIAPPGQKVKTAIAGAKLGTAIGAGVGAAFGYMWHGLSEEVKNTIENSFIAATSVGIVGGILGMLIGAFIAPPGQKVKTAIAGAKLGLGIGAGVGMAFGALWSGLSDDIKKKIESSFVNASYGAITGGLMGMLLGAFIGNPGQKVSTAIAGARLGAGIGAGLGLALGAFFGDAEDSFSNFVEGLFSSVSAAAKGAFYGGLAGMIIGAIVGAFAGGIGALPGAKLGAMLGASMGSLAGLVYDALSDSGVLSGITDFFGDIYDTVTGWFSSIGKAISKGWEGLWSGMSSGSNVWNPTRGPLKLGGHATGGIFNREHIARFAEGNKAEAVIPLENASAMQPFVTAISDGILQGLMPVMAVSGGGSNSLPPMYVGTLIADERGLEQLYKKFEVYEAKELARKGMA